MASPQLKNGFVRMANEIYENLARYRIPGEARQVMDFIIRKTYGWNKVEDVIPLSQFVAGTGLKKATVCRAINKLIHLNLIIKKDNDRGTSYRFNKNFETWTPLTKKITQKVMHTESTGALSKKIMAGSKTLRKSWVSVIILETLNRQYQKTITIDTDGSDY